MAVETITRGQKATLRKVPLRGVLLRSSAAALALVGAAGVGLLVATHHSYGVGLAFGALIVALAAFRLEAAYVALVALALITPPFVGYGAWIIGVSLVTVLAFVYAVASHRQITVATPLIFYIGAYTLAVIHAGPNGTDALSFAKYVGPPLFAIATGLVARERDMRRLLLWLVIAGALIQVPVALFQARSVLAHPLSAGKYADHVYGLLLVSKPLGDVAAITGILLLALAVAGVRHARLCVLGSLALFALPVLAAVKAAEFMIPAGLLVLALVAWISSRDASVRRRAKVLLLVAALAAPALIAIEITVYPSTAPALTTTSGLLTYLEAKAGASEGPVPDRAVALKEAVRLTAASNPATAFLGEGPGATNINLSNRLKPFAQQADLLVTPRQVTNRVWVARTLVEAGILGVIAFLVLLGYLFDLGRRGTKLLGRGDPDLGVMIALPGIAVVTLIAAFEDTVLSLQPVTTVFWLLAGIGMAAMWDAKERRSAAGPARTGVASDTAALEPAR